MLIRVKRLHFETESLQLFRVKGVDLSSHPELESQLLYGHFSFNIVIGIIYVIPNICSYIVLREELTMERQEF